MTIGEPRHAMPAFVADAITDAVDGFSRYPVNEGAPELLAAISAWLCRRYGVSVEEDRLVALNGTREGLYNAAMALCPESKGGKPPVVLMPNPFYQVYAVAALSVGAEPVYLPATAETGHLPDLDAIPAETLARTAIFYLCSPSNPQGAVADAGYWARLLELSERHGFRIFADECYSEIYRGDAPPGILAAAERRGSDPESVLAFHSLSKRSNLPGLRSGFAAGGRESIARLRQLRAYAGAPLPLPLQQVAALVWADEAHVEENRALYAEKYRVADEILAGIDGYQPPRAGFFQWLPVEDGEAAALKLWTETGVRVLPGAYLGRDAGGGNPGASYIRVAMVAQLDEMRRGLTQIRACLYD
ncbi:putative aspartate aminotransferase [Oceanicola granulosus HTCC2516]|uniref:Putative aspartate aminotransferase n=2 Tax=Oceanicola granulosus TaxID=252302 RepID=Q2CAJ9_OCEGH|nr:putative aspartate aminotransferase [Oceanicola granulosus HTCC2516]